METNRSDVMAPELLSYLAERGESRTYARNELLIAEGDMSDALYVLVSGQCKVFTQDEKGRELVYNLLQPGELFGEMFLDGGVRSASVRAISETRCTVVDQALIQALVRSSPAFAEFLIFKLIGRLRHSTELCKHLALSGVFVRTVAVLEGCAVLEDGVRMIPTSLTQQEIADRVGATREMINHVIRDLVQGGFLARSDQRKWLILKPLPRRW